MQKASRIIMAWTNGILVNPVRISALRAAVVVALVCLSAFVCLSRSSPPGRMATAKAVKAANQFLATLNPQQQQRVEFAFYNNMQRRRWSNLPVQMVPRAGVSMGELTAPQRTAALHLLSAVLSRRGFEKVQQIMAADQTLKTSQGNNPMFGEALYFISILGAPSEKTPWMLQFGGHHLALNITIAGDHGVLTPSLTGAQPALYTANGKTIRPLGQENDRAFALLNALDPTQRDQAILKYRVADLVLGPGQDGRTILPEGLKATAMTGRQRKMLVDLISEWTGIVNEGAAADRMDEVKAGLDNTYFAWSGPTTCVPGHNGAAYYRIQGPRLVIEYAPQPLGGDPSMHIHTIYRDPTNDYGRMLVAQ